MRLLLAVMLTAAPAYSAGKADVGTAAAPFLKLGPDPRAAAMGEAFSALAEEPSALYFNPAGLAAIERLQFQVSQAFYLQSMSYQFVGYAQPVAAIFHQFETGPGRMRAVDRGPDWGVLAAGVTYLNSGSIDKTDNTGAAAGSFSPADLAAALAYGRAFGTVDLGLSAKFVESKIDRVATTFAADAGARWRTELDGRPVVLAAAIRNAGGKLKFNKEEEALPLTWVVGAAIHPAAELAAAVEVTAPSDNKPFVSLGLEGSQTLNGLKGSLRLGWKGAQSDSGLGGLAGLTAGAGIAFEVVRVDYAWVPFGVLGDTHRIGLSLKF